jgi:hypothetical protein
VVDGPLIVCSRNPRYFATADDADRAVLLTGSHVNNNLHDGLGFGQDCPDSPEVFDFDAYLEFLAEHGHNFVRLWRWEQFKGYLGPADVHFCMTPQPWARTGPGLASDGKPRFDLGTFDASYFQRLRQRVAAADALGIYVSVMLFEGFSLHLTDTPDNIAGHPLGAGNNINDVAIESIVDYQVLPLEPAVAAIQEAYIRKVVDTVHDLPNVLYEVANESSGMTADAVEMPGGMKIDTPIGDSTRWQYGVIDLVKGYEREAGRTPHPIGMTFLYPVAEPEKANDPLWASPADWISPGVDDSPVPGDTRWRHDPPSADGRKVVISDNDHYSPMEVDAVWAWKSFLRGHNPILYDLGIVDGRFDPPDPGLEPARLALGDIRRLADSIDLTSSAPAGELASSGYVLTWPGHDYLVLRPAGEGDLSVSVESGTYDVRWYDIAARSEREATSIALAEHATVTLDCPLPPDVNGVVRLARREDGS